MNRLEEVLKLFDLKVEQEFKLTNSSAFYKISKFGQIYFKIEENKWEKSHWELANLITGMIKIEGVSINND